MNDFCDFLKGFDSSEDFMGKLVEAAILKAEILNYELLDGTTDIEVPDVTTEGTFDSMYHEMTVDEYYEAERLN